MKLTNIKLNQWFRSLKLLSIVSVTGLLMACSTTPEKLNFDQNSVSFIQVAQAPDSFVGNQVRWGGIVARVENLEQDTLIEIVNLPLDRRARPMANQQTGGRFIARVQGFVDPLIYSQGKEITVVGILNQPMPGQIGQHEVNFPVVDSSGHHLWEQRQSYQHVSVFSTWDPFWFGNVGYRWHRPFYNRYPRYPYCPIHHTYHRAHNDANLIHREAPSPTNVVRPRADYQDSQPNLNEVRRQTLRERPVRVETPRQVRETDIPKSPRRIDPRVYEPKVKAPKTPRPTAPRDPRRVLKVK